MPQFEPPWLPGIDTRPRSTAGGMNSPPYGPVPLFAFATRSRMGWYCSGVSSHGFTSSTVNDCLANGGGLGRERLRRREYSPGTSVFGTGPLLDRPERLAGHAIEDVEEAGLAGVSDDVDVAGRCAAP